MERLFSAVIAIFCWSFFCQSISYAGSISFKNTTIEELTRFCYQAPDDLYLRSYVEEENYYNACTTLVNRSDDRYEHAIKYLWVMSETGNVNPLTKNKQDLFDYVQSQAEKKNPDAMALMGVLYKRGQFVERNIELAKSYYERAFSLHRQSQNEPFYYYISRLGRLYESDKVKTDDGNQNIDKAREYYEFCASKYLIECQHELARFYKEGKAGYPKDIEKAVVILEELVHKHNAPGPLHSLIEWHMDEEHAIYNPKVAGYWYCRLQESLIKAIVDFRFPDLKNYCV